MNNAPVVKVLTAPKWHTMKVFFGDGPADFTKKRQLLQVVLVQMPDDVVWHGAQLRRTDVLKSL